MKRTIASTLAALALTVGLAFACIAGCAKKNDQTRQTATAYLNQAGNAITATVDLSNGYSCDFARGAIYLYDQENKEGVPSVAMGIAINEDVYNDHIKASKEAKDSTEIKDGVMYSADGRMIYIRKVGDAGFFGVFAEHASPAQMENLISRFEVAPEI